MPSKARALGAIAALTASLVLATPGRAAGQSDPFTLTHVKKPSLDPGPTLTLLVSSSGAPLPETELKDKGNWRLFIVTDDEGSRRVAVDSVAWSARTKMASLVFQRSATFGADLAKAGWMVVFVGSQRSMISADVPSSGRFKAAKDKDDASLYAFGSVLVGPSTKPLYVIDLKADYGDQVGTSPWLWHVDFTANTNTDAEPPVDKVTINPDAITTAVSFSKRRKLDSRYVNAMHYTVEGIRGEFSRKDGLADAVTAGEVKVDFKPIANALTIYPSAGYEIGHAIRRPDTVKDQPVDLSAWGPIARGVLGVSGRWTLFKAKPTEKDLFVVTISAAYTARVLFAEEPSAQPGVVNGEPAVVTTVNKDVRHHAEAELNWNLTKYTSVSLKYQYGALPPLFPLVDHQVTIGVTLKAAAK